MDSFGHDVCGWDFGMCLEADHPSSGVPMNWVLRVVPEHINILLEGDLSCFPVLTHSQYAHGIYSAKVIISVQPNDPLTSG